MQKGDVVVKIVDQTLNKEIRFWDIKRGTVFRRKKDNECYMRTELVTDLNEEECNAVLLSQGYMMYIAPDEIVENVDCELVVR